MIEFVIAFINGRLAALNFFEEVKGLAERLEKEVEDDEGTQIFPAIYCDNGNYDYIDDLTQWENGLAYHRLLSEFTEPGEGEAVTACDKIFRKTFEMRLVALVPKSIFDAQNDDKYIDQKIINNIENAIFASNEPDIVNTLKVDVVSIQTNSSDADRYSVFGEEHENVKFNIGFEYAYVAVNYTVVIEATQSCFQNFDCDGLTAPVFCQATVNDANNPASPILLGNGETYECVSGIADMTANFTVDDDTPTLGQLITFTDTTDEAPTQWLWDVGDGDTSTDPNPTHVYTDLGTHTVTLSASNIGKQGDTVIKVDFITVSVLPLNAGIELYLNDTFTTDANNLISQWNTDAGVDHATQATANRQPLLHDNYFGMKAVNFGRISSGCVMETPYELIPPYTIFAIGQAQELANDKFFMSAVGGNFQRLRFRDDGSGNFEGGYIRLDYALITPNALQGIIKKYGLKLVTVTCDVPSTANGLKLYIDGVFDVQANTNAVIATPQKTWIGGLNDTSNTNRGQDILATVMVHNAVLTCADLAAYNNFFIEKHGI